MKKILGFMGSPRKRGNTHLLLKTILESAEELGGHTELIFLNDLIMKECDGCHACWKGKECSKMDDINHLYPKIATSDILVFGTPVYWYGPTALMKLLLDRFVYFNCEENRAKIRGKKAVIVIPYEEKNRDTAKPLEIMFEKSFEYLELDLIDRLIVPGVTKRGEVAEDPDIMTKCVSLGETLSK